MSARLDLFSVEQLERQHGLLVVYCRRCSNRSMFYAAELSQRYGKQKVLWNLRFRCSNCGHRRPDIHPYVPLNVR